MRFIQDRNKLARINKLAKDGDKKAKEFLLGFSEMSDDDINAYFASLDEKKPEDSLQSLVEYLVGEEEQAIMDYEKAIDFIKNSDLPNMIKESYIAKLEHIKGEEEEHIDELKEIQ